MDAPPVATVSGVFKRYGSVNALDGLTAAIRANTITALLGRNGAGKTTMLQVLTGQVVPTSGTVRVFGENPYENASVLSRTCLIREAQRYPDMFRVRHVLQAASLLHESWDSAFAAELMRDFALPYDRKMKRLSRGMVSAVGVVVGLASRAPLTMFDEPYLGLDATGRALFYDHLLADYAAHPRTVILSTHLIDEVSDLIEQVLVVDRGRALLDCDAESLQLQAISVTGPHALVDQFLSDMVVLHREELAGTSRATATGDLGPATRKRADLLGLTLEPVSLQQLVIRTTTHAAASAAFPHPDFAAAAGDGR